jgi:peptidoglycan hydrolase-like protein with peptidoglycan-binding domain
MLPASKVAWAGIVFILLTTGISGPRRTMLASGAHLTEEVPVVKHPTDVNTIQEALLNKGHYRGKIDGIFGLRTRASVRAYQKSENLRVTGQLDTQTATRLGVRLEGREQTGYETPQGKPSAGIKSAGRTSKPLAKAVKRVASPESGRTDRQKTLQAENDNHPK